MSRAPRYAARVDENQKDIIDALEKIGCKVFVIGRPVDLLVGYRSRNFLIECKNPDSRYGAKNESTPTQRHFLAHWPGQVRIVYTAEEAIELVTRSYNEPS